MIINLLENDRANGLMKEILNNWSMRHKNWGIKREQLNKLSNEKGYFKKKVIAQMRKERFIHKENNYYFLRLDNIRRELL